MRRVIGACVSAMLVVGWVPEGVNASIGSTSGNVTKIAPPASTLLNVLEHATNAFAFAERQGVTLASPLRTDIQTPGTYDQTSDLTTVSVPAGTVVDSHLVHSDRPGVGTGSTGTILRNFTVTFPTDILGIIATQGKLTDSDVLGAPGTIYGGTARALSFGVDSGSDILVLPDQRTVVATLRTTFGLDQFRVLTRHNAPPITNAGGPYAGVEGAPVALAGTAADPAGDALSTSWSIIHTSDPGTTCSLAAAATLTPTVTCTDDALVTATLSVNDGVNPPVTSATQVTIGNVAPAFDAVTVPAAPLALGSAANVSVDFTDAGTNDTHTVTVAWGDTLSSAGTVTEAGGTGSASAAHTYALPGLYTISITLTDDDGGTIATSAQITVNGPPSSDAGGPYSGAEGLPTALAGSAVDPENDPLTVGWTFTPSALDAGGACTSNGGSTVTPTVSCTDDAVVAAAISASDGINPAAVSSTTVAVANEAPMLGALGVTTGPIATGAPVTVIAPFTDDGTNDTHTASVNWGDLSATSATVGELAGAGSLSGTHSYATPGIYTITVTLSDDDLGIDERTTTVVVNSAPEVSAGGPYAGLEGASLSLGGTASDADGDALTISWAFAVTGGPGVVCTPIGAGTLTPTLTCNDDATVIATLTVSDGVNPSVTSSATVSVGNTQPVSTGAVGSDSTAPPGSTVSVGMAFSDDGTNDTHSATIDWGDGTVEAGTIGGTSSSGTVSGSHVYTTSGSYTITVTLVDDDGAPVTATTAILINGVPVVGAGGPYSGVEGAPVTLNGTAADPDADALLVSWSSVIVTADAGTACTLSDATTLTPSLLCDDDARVDVTLTVADGVNPTVVSTVRATIANANPAVASPNVTPNPVPLGTPISLSATFTDPGVNDNHTATIVWGDATSSAGSVTEVPGSGFITGGHTYAAPGTYLVKVTANDKDGGTNTATIPVVVNAPPEIDAAGPYSGQEGVPLALAGTATDADGDPLALTWSFATSTDPGGTCSMTGTATLVPSVTCTDDATITATLTADDGVNPPLVDTATITIANQTPGIGLVTVPVAPVPVGTSVSVLTTFVDAGSNDSHTATVSWGDASATAGVVTEAAGNGSVTASHAYSAPGTYTVSVNVVDDDTGSVTGTAAASVVVFDGGNGFVTGGGWINSPSGAHTPNNSADPNLGGRGEFGFVIRKRATDPAPTGNTEFQLRLRRLGDSRDRGTGDDRRDDGWSRTANFNFHSTAYTALAVTGSTKAVYRGTGRVDGTSGYEFLVSVIDGRSTSSADRFRIKVWKTSTGEVLYDNQHGALEDASATSALSGGSIVIHN